MKTLASASIAVLFAAASAVSAATFNVDTYQSTAAFPSDTRLNGSATNSAVTIDGTNSTVKLVSVDGTDGQEKVAPFFSTGTAAAIGTLGDLGRGGLSADWLLESRGTNTPSFVGNIAAFRLLVDGPTAGTFAEIIWETAYQTVVPTFVQGTNYNDVDLGSGKFWSRYLGQNYGQGDNGPVNALTLAQLAAGGQLTGTAPTFTDTTPVYGLQVSIGSGAGDYTAYVGDINATFTAVPEPTTLAVFGLGLLGLLRRRVIR